MTRLIATAVNVKLVKRLPAKLVNVLRKKLETALIVIVPNVSLAIVLQRKLESELPKRPVSVQSEIVLIVIVQKEKSAIVALTSLNVNAVIVLPKRLANGIALSAKQEKTQLVKPANVRLKKLVDVPKSRAVKLKLPASEQQRKLVKELIATE